jgi:hypothetical protein
MAKQQKARFGNKAKARRQAHNQATGKYVRQRARTEANKRKRRARHLAKHPNDLQAQNV